MSEGLEGGGAQRELVNGLEACRRTGAGGGARGLGWLIGLEACRRMGLHAACLAQPCGQPCQ